MANFRQEQRPNLKEIQEIVTRAYDIAIINGWIKDTRTALEIKHEQNKGC